MEILQTPEERFSKLPDYNFEPHYITRNGARMHYIDEGQGEVILCLHGEPSWSYLYRKFYPILSPHYRVISPDFIGFGKSDKYTKIRDYTFQMHLQSIIGFIEKLDLKDITVVVQDWGGLLGLAAVGQIPERFGKLVILNTTLPTGEKKVPLFFKLWQLYARYIPVFGAAKIVNWATQTELSKEVLRAYDAPFPSNKYKAGARAWPPMVPTKPTADGVAEMIKAREVLKEWKKPAFVMFSDKDPVMRGRDKWFRKYVLPSQDQPFVEIKNAGHFLQEDKGEEIAEHIKGFMGRTPIG